MNNENENILEENFGFEKSIRSENKIKYYSNRSNSKKNLLTKIKKLRKIEWTIQSIFFFQKI